MDDITYRELIGAYANYRKFEGAPYNHNTKLRFQEFLGFAAFTKLWEAQADYAKGNPTVIPKAAAKKIRWLNGPHGYTLYKAWKAQHEDKH